MEIAAEQTVIATTRTETALNLLGQRIVNGEFAVGETLPIEPNLAQDLGVSRTTVREAVRSLVTMGMLEVRPRSGTRVRPRHNWNILNRDVLYWMMQSNKDTSDLIAAIDEAREVFEPQAAALAAQRASRSDVAAISAGYEGMAVAAELDNIEKAIMADREFHLAILKATGNPILMAFDTAIDAVLGILFTIASADHRQIFKLNLENHRRILEAIRSGDAEEASRAMTETIQFTRESLKRHVLKT